MIKFGHRLGRFIVVAWLAVVVAGCTLPSPAPTLTPLQIQALQTREYEESKEIVFPSVISVFQDLGYIIKSADITTGLVTADSAVKGGSDWDVFLGFQSTIRQTVATAFVERIGKTTRLRLNILQKNSSSSFEGQQHANDTIILDAKIYQNAFERIENAIFVRSSN